MALAQLPFAAAVAIAGMGILDTDRQSEPPKIIYRCHWYGNLGDSSTALTLDKTFYEDGSVASMSVLWEDHVSQLVNPNPASSVADRMGRGEHGSVTLHWPGDRHSSERGPLAWERGTIAVHFFPRDSAARYRLSRDERWRQVFVDRDRSAKVVQDKANRHLLVNGLGMYLSSDILEPSSPGNLQMRLDDFLAWGAGAKSVTVFETVVRYRRPTKDSSPSSPIGMRRIVAEYDVDVPGIARRVREIGEATKEWEAGLGDFRKCEKTVEESGDILVTQKF